MKALKILFSALIGLCLSKSAKAEVPEQNWYTVSTSRACYQNSEDQGGPTLCLETRLAGSDFPNAWEFRICKIKQSWEDKSTELNESLVTFDDGYEWWLEGLPLPHYEGEAGVHCSEWQYEKLFFDCNKPTIVQASVYSPKGCNKSGCLYQTGAIEFFNICTEEPKQPPQSSNDGVPQS